jgi:ABC-2 type transport system ATP-binding protein
MGGALEILRAEKLTKEFNGVPVVNQLTFSVEKGSLFGLLGPDGAGKSTTLKLLSGQLTPTSGTGWVAGFDCAKDTAKIKTVARHMSQGFDLYPDLTVWENLHFFADILSIPKSAQGHKIEQLLAFTHLAPFQMRQASKLSGGMKQKLALAVAVLGTPQVLFLDEPTSGVDPVSRRDFWIALHHLRSEGVTLFITTTYLDEAERCANVGLLYQGKLLTLGSPKQLKQQFPGVLMAIQCDNPRRATFLLKQGLPGDQIDLFGDRVHVSATHAHGLVEKIRLVLADQISIHHITPIAPTLEDLFISLIANAKEETNGQR